MKEDLIRLEFKIDLIIEALQVYGIMVPDLPDLRGIESDLCPVCTQKVRLLINAEAGELIRACGCKLPKQAYKLEITKTLNTKEADYASDREQENELPSE